MANSFTTLFIVRKRKIKYLLKNLILKIMKIKTLRKQFSESWLNDKISLKKCLSLRKKIELTELKKQSFPQVII
jgi:hypothetical protein